MAEGGGPMILGGRDMFFHAIERAAREWHWKELDRIEWAYSLAKRYHHAQRRNNGERYFEHCRAVALTSIVFGPCYPDEVIMGLLHDAYEDQFVPQGMFRQLFGIGVDQGLASLSHEKVVYGQRGHIERVKIPVDVYFAALMESPRPVRRVKICDRMHNIETLDACPKDKQRAKLDETRLYVYPLAQMTDDRMYIELQSLVTKREAAL